MSKILEVHDLCVSFEPEPGEVLKSVTFSLEEGERVALVGPSGCGKTTLLRSLAGLVHKLNHGRIHWDESVTKPVPIVWQDVRLFPWLRVRANIQYPLSLQRASMDQVVDELLDIIEMRWAANLWPNQLSRGQAQRVAFARSLAMGASILLLDEPFASLDVLARRQLGDFLRRLADRRSFGYLLVSHDVDEALRLANRVLVLSKRPARIVKEYRRTGGAFAGTASAAIWSALDGSVP